jgi:hypothetical protein
MTTVAIPFPSFHTGEALRLERCPSILSFRLGALLFLAFDANVDHGVDRRSLASWHGKQVMRQNSQFVEGIVGIVRLAIALFN